MKPTPSPPRLLHAVDDHAFVVGLESFQADAGSPGGRLQATVDLGQRLPAVEARLPRAEKIQVRSVQDQH